MTKKFQFTKDDLEALILAALNETPAAPTNQPAKPNILQLMRSKKEMGNEGKTWPLV